MTISNIEAVKPQTSSQLMDGEPLREFIMLAGKDSTGKTTAIVSLAWWIQQIQPDVTFYVIDTENKFKAAMRSFKKDAPTNIVYYKCDNMNAVTSTVSDILGLYKPGDWLAVESLSRIWERAQDLAYNVLAGVSKIEYLERRARVGKGSGPIPPPKGDDDFWKVAKGAHDGAFFDLLSTLDDLNCIFTTTIAKPPKEQTNRKENVDRKALRVELGIDSNLEGAPRLPYYLSTLCILDLNAGRVSCRVLRDNLSSLEDGRIEFEVPGKKMWGITFWEQCRN